MNKDTNLVDVQASRDLRQIDIDKVGVRAVKFPIKVRDRSNEWQHTIGNFTLTVELPHNFKGTHMSRFLEALNENNGEISSDALPNLLSSLKQRLDAKRAHVEVQFPFFQKRAAPVTGLVGVMEYDCGFHAQCNGEITMLAKVPVTTLCPCSKEISAYGAHNQRGVVSVCLKTEGMLWLEEVIEMIEASASCALFPILKRTDEKWVTERAYDNPRFVEDMVREVAVLFNKEPRIKAYEIEVENFESIHAHNAYAYLKRSRE